MVSSRAKLGMTPLLRTTATLDKMLSVLTIVSRYMRELPLSLKPIRTRVDHSRALEEIERLMGAKRGSTQANRLAVLSALVAAYEAAHDRIDLPEPFEAIEAHMVEPGLGQADLAHLLGSRSLASAILNRKRPMSLTVIRKLSAAWDIPTDVLVQPYKLAGQRPGRAA